LVSEFAKNEYAKFVYLNFEQNRSLKSLFTNDLSPKNIIENLSLLQGKKIEAENTLIFFDEIQIVPEAITSLKYFYEEAPEFHIIAAGSLLGVSLGKDTSFPVGKVNFMKMVPMSFYEYLLVINEELIANKILNMNRIESLPEVLHDKLLKQFKLFLYIGGMPEVLQHYIDQGDIQEARKIQSDILEAYSRDFSKYTEKTQAIKTSELWQSIPFQLAREKKKFKYGDVRKGGRSSAFGQTIQWLKNAGLINVVYNVSKPGIPLAGYANHSHFKIYLLDTGLLGALLNLNSKIVLQPTEIFSEYNGAFVENAIAAELVALGMQDLHYWTSKSDAEVDYLISIENRVIPIEVKSGMNRNLKSLRSYSDKYQPSHIIRFSPRNFYQDKDFINIPLYAVFGAMSILNKIITGEGA